MPETQADSLTTAAAAPAAEKKTLFGKYEVGRLLGCGGFAKVYHARDVRTGHSVAIKAISKAKIEKNELTNHIIREISIMKKLRHPNIVTLEEVLATKNRIYVVIEFAKGGELFSKVAKGRFSEDLARRYFQQLTSAVKHCHSRGVYHRDLKPENLLLDENWNLKVTDFGLSAVKEQIKGTDGMLHTLCGTPAYVAPEVLEKKGYFGAKIDIWSCGIILFVLTAGYLPFNDTNLMNLYRKIYKGEFRCPKWMSPELKHLLHRLLDVNPENRITIEEILHDPWFKKGYKEVNFMFYDDLSVNKQGGSTKYLNAFDLISFSPGFQLSGLFMDSGSNKEEIRSCETFVSAEELEKVVEGVERAARDVDAAQKLAVERVKGGMGVRVEGQNGNFGLVVEVHRLTKELVVVEVRMREQDVGASHDFWTKKLRPKISHLIYKSGQVSESPSALPGPLNRVEGV